MTPAEIIRAAQSKGVRLVVADGKLKCRGNRGAIAHLVEVIRHRKAEIIAELQAANGNTDGAPNPPQTAPQAESGLLVECYTPAGGRILVKARDQAHAEWLARMNPPPSESVTKSNRREEPTDGR